MARTVAYYLALNSPWSFLGSARLGAIAKDRGATVNVCPVDTGRLFQATGGLPLGQRPKSRRTYRMRELKRWRERLGIPLVLEPAAFPFDERLAAACLLAEKAKGTDILDLATAFGHALWVDDRNPADRVVLADVLTARGLDAEAILADAEEHAEHWETERRSNTDAAIAAGAFGVPTYVVEGDVFWGQDRLDFVDETLA